ncbi:hypothetical protein OCK74_09745 [Chitinophagaceae bacterium LB-8]|uniref:Uncharacterized protein n=1 Tax=Paraflavisolibacter caeni TaxID=2982496 RepID=A0A9X3BHD6_9BACT|nr:hypothetical protein [Paraflavisolibacter caeni]MCU7549397.1 hypothetical protein [Paraflavisolibacter caeni]
MFRIWLVYILVLAISQTSAQQFNSDSWLSKPHGKVTHGQEFNGNLGAGFEFGIMLFTPQFACFGGCNKDAKQQKDRKRWKLFK